MSLPSHGISQQEESALSASQQTKAYETVPTGISEQEISTEEHSRAFDTNKAETSPKTTACVGRKFKKKII